jgi:hypothetical protein
VRSPRKFFARGQTTVVYNEPALSEDEERLRGNEHSEDETTLSEGELNMAKKAHKKAAKKKVSKKKSKK